MLCKKINHRYTYIKVAAAFYFIFSSAQLPAQVCNGTYANPVWVNNFVKGIYPGDSLPSGKTSYSYTSGNCPANGYYTITNVVANCFGNSWDTIPGNVPTNVVGGSFMLINGSPDAGGTIYIDTIKNLCSNTNYGFGAWVFNVSLRSSCGGHPIRPRLTFRAEAEDGTVLGYYSTGDIVEGVPTEYSVQFSTSTASNSVVIRVTGDVPGGCGNAFALDGLFISPCVPVITAGIESDFCAGANSFTTLFATVGNAFSSPSFQWQIHSDTGWADIPGANSLTYVASADTGTSAVYRLAVAEEGNIGNMTCQVASDTIPVYKGIPNAVGVAASNSPVCENSMIVLSASGGKSYQWAGTAGFASTDQNPGFKATNASAGQYTVTIADGYGCMTTATTTVSLLSAPTVVVSNAQSICKGDSVGLQASGGTVYTWLPPTNLSDDGISNPIAKPDSTSMYTVTVANNNFCVDTASVLVVVNTKPIISAGDDKAIIKGQSVTLDGSVKDLGNGNFSWLTSVSLSDIHVLDPVANPVINTDYVLTATSGSGCGISTDTVTVKVYNGLQIPNAFTPNGDSHNDVWHIPALESFSGAVVSVYNRYGQKVFESSTGNKDWDGKYKNVAQPAGAYPYVIDLKNNSPVIKGVVLIVR